MNDQFGTDRNIVNNSSNNDNTNLLLNVSFNVLTNIISFLDCIQRCRLMQLSLYIYNACNSNISKYHCLINFLMSKHTFHINQFYPTKHLKIANSNTVSAVDVEKFTNIIYQIVKNSPKLHTIELKNCRSHCDQIIEESIYNALDVNSKASIKNIIIDGSGLQWDHVKQLCYRKFTRVKRLKSNIYSWSTNVVCVGSKFSNVKNLSLCFNDLLVLVNSIFLLSQFKQLKELELDLDVDKDDFYTNNSNDRNNNNNPTSSMVNQAFATLKNRLQPTKQTNTTNKRNINSVNNKKLTDTGDLDVKTNDNNDSDCKNVDNQVYKCDNTTCDLNRLILHLNFCESGRYRSLFFVKENASRIMYNFIILFLECLKQCKIINFANLFEFSFSCFHFSKNNNSKIQYQSLQFHAKSIMEKIIKLFKFDDSSISGEGNNNSNYSSGFKLEKLKLTMHCEMMKTIVEELLDNKYIIPSLQQLFLRVSAYDASGNASFWYLSENGEHQYQPDPPMEELQHRASHIWKSMLHEIKNIITCKKYDNVIQSLHLKVEYLHKIYNYYPHLTTFLNELNNSSGDISLKHLSVIVNQGCGFCPHDMGYKTLYNSIPLSFGKIATQLTQNTSIKSLYISPTRLQSQTETWLRFWFADPFGQCLLPKISRKDGRGLSTIDKLYICQHIERD